MSDQQQTPAENEEQVAAAEAAATETTKAGTDEAASAEAGDPQAQIASLTEQLEEARNQVLRAQAEAQNTRRRAEQDVEKAHKFGQEKIINDLLPVVDNLERALASIDVNDEAFKAVIEGIELTHKSFVDSLKRHKVEQINPEGEPFDPQLHQAMSMVENPDVEPNTVINVFQKGYTLHGRLVRPAMVVVSKAPA